MKPNIEAPALTRWQQNPVSAEEHDQFCDQGVVHFQEGPYERVAVCPVCERERSIKLTMINTQRNLDNSGIGSRYTDVEWDDLQEVPQAAQLRRAGGRIGEVVESGFSLLLYGPPGSGKTQCAVLLVKDAIRAGHSAQVANLGMLATGVRESYNDDSEAEGEAEAIRRLASCDLLVLDDLGAGESSRAEVERRVLYQVTEARQNAQRITVITSNLAPDALAKKVGVRILNRFQPLTPLLFNHGRNFRAEVTKASPWL